MPANRDLSSSILRLRVPICVCPRYLIVETNGGYAFADLILGQLIHDAEFVAVNSKKVSRIAC